MFVATSPSQAVALSLSSYSFQEEDMFLVYIFFGAWGRRTSHINQLKHVIAIRMYVLILISLSPERCEKNVDVRYHGRVLYSDSN